MIRLHKTIADTGVHPSVFPPAITLGSSAASVSSVDSVRVSCRSRASDFSEELRLSVRWVESFRGSVNNNVI